MCRSIPPIRRFALAAALVLVALGSSGCSALIGAAFRELEDDGPCPRYERQGYWNHFVGEVLESDGD